MVQVGDHITRFYVIKRPGVERRTDESGYRVITVEKEGTVLRVVPEEQWQAGERQIGLRVTLRKDGEYVPIGSAITPSHTAFTITKPQGE